VILKAAAGQAQKLLGDTAARLLEAQLGIRTFVKAAAPPPRPRKEGRGGSTVRPRFAAYVAALLAAAPLAPSPRPGLAAQVKPTPAPAAKPDSSKRDSAAAPVLVREVFSYEGGGRDPFLSLLKSGDIRPLLSDLRLVASTTTGGIRRAASRCCAM